MINVPKKLSDYWLVNLKRILLSMWQVDSIYTIQTLTKIGFVLNPIRRKKMSNSQNESGLPSTSQY